MSSNDYTYKIFFSSIIPETGKMWCPDCTLVLPVVTETFSISPAQHLNRPRAEIVYVGDKPFWRSGDNIYRKEPYNLTGIPSILKFDSNGTIVNRLDGEDAILDQKILSKFLVETS